jgi:hypothetical protein
MPDGGDDLILRLVDQDWRTGRAAEAFARLETALTIEPTVEEFVRAALRLSLEIGNSDAGRTLYDALVRRLNEDELEPASETTQLAERLRNPSPRVALPGHPDPFIGRSDELARLADELTRRRCIVLHGPPGIGKSRLATEVCARAAERFVDGVWWIDAENLDDGALEARAVRALGPRTNREESLVERLRDRSALLIFDACESDAAQCEATIRSLLVGTSGTRVIATSTKRLRIAGGTVWAVEPLRSSDALALFAARASEVAPARELDAADRAIAIDICSALDNMPLTIEFAARRTRLRSLAAIRDEVRRAPGEALAVSIARAVAPLSTATLDVFSTLAAFRSDFRLETAAGICKIDDERMSDVLDELTGASLVNVVTFDDEPRVEILATRS